jgi:hypothetical protein
MGIGSITFSLPHFLTGNHHTTTLTTGNNSSMSNICKSHRVLAANKAKTSAEEGFLMSLPGLEKLKSQIEGKLASSNAYFKIFKSS